VIRTQTNHAKAIVFVSAALPTIAMLHGQTISEHMHARWWMVSSSKSCAARLAFSFLIREVQAQQHHHWAQLQRLADEQPAFL